MNPQRNWTSAGGARCRSWVHGGMLHVAIEVGHYRGARTCLFVERTRTVDEVRLARLAGAPPPPAETSADLLDGGGHAW